MWKPFKTHRAARQRALALQGEDTETGQRVPQAPPRPPPRRPPSPHAPPAGVGLETPSCLLDAREGRQCSKGCGDRNAQKKRGSTEDPNPPRASL